MQEICQKTLDLLKKKQTFAPSATIPGQSMPLRELLERFQNGQRLNVSSSPMNEMVSFNPITGESPEDMNIDDDPNLPSGNFEDDMIRQQQLQAQLKEANEKKTGLVEGLKKKIKEAKEKKEVTPTPQPTE